MVTCYRVSDGLRSNSWSCLNVCYEAQVFDPLVTNFDDREWEVLNRGENTQRWQRASIAFAATSGCDGGRPSWSVYHLTSWHTHHEG